MTLSQAKTPLFRKKMGLFQLFPMATILVSLHFLIIFYVSNIPLAFAQNENQFIYNGFLQAELHLDGSAKITSNGLLLLTNAVNISYPQVGHAFFQFPLKIQHYFLRFKSISLIFYKLCICHCSTSAECWRLRHGLHYQSIK